MAPLAMEMVRDIEKETVDFQPNYDGKTQEPTVLPARFPNLLVNGSAGIAVGMATSIPPHNLREVAEGAQWALDHPEATREELLEALLEHIKGPDFPTGALIMGHKGIEDAYRTGRGSIIMRAVVEVEEIQGRQLPGDHRAALPGQPRQPRAEDRRAGQGRQARRASPTSATRPPAAPASAWSSCSSATPSPRSCSTTSTSTPQLQTQLRRQHAGPGRRGAAHAAARRSSSGNWVDAPGRGHPAGAPTLPAAQGRGARSTSCAACSRRSTRSTRSSR